MNKSECCLKKAIELDEMNIYFSSLKNLLSDVEYAASNDFSNIIDNDLIMCSFNHVQENLSELISSLKYLTEELLLESDKLARVSGYVFNLDAKLVKISGLSN